MSYESKSRGAKYFVKRNGRVLAIYALIFAILYIVFKLYGISLEPFIYALCLSAAALIVILSYDAYRLRKKDEVLKRMTEQNMLDKALLPNAETCAEELLANLALYEQEARLSLLNETQMQRQDYIDYYSAWAHKIKTPIAVMRFIIEDAEENVRERLKQELFRIEQYVEMVLQYARLEADTNDLVVGKYSLDEMLREVISKYAELFVHKKLKLNIAPCNVFITTDKKWFEVIIDQIISNAIKYTSHGGIDIRLEGSRLIITDTGIGIAPEDLPRIFEKGYTGYNGRSDKKSSGIGLYLCAGAAKKLAIVLSAMSTLGQGSSFILEISGHLCEEGG